MGAGKGKNKRVVTKTVTSKPRTRTPRKIPRHYVVREGNGALVETMQRVTSKGVKCKLDVYQGMEGKMSPGWVTDLIEARTEDGPAGYMKISYIPKEAMERFYPSAYGYQVRLNGGYPHVRNIIDVPQSQWKRADYVAALNDFNARGNYNQSNMQELRKLWKQARQKITERGNGRYERWRDYWCDQPLVDSVRVYEEGETIFYYKGDQVLAEEGSSITVSSQRQGVATLMYEAANELVRSRGLRLYASDVQSDDAKRIWEQFEKQGLTQIVGRGKSARMVLDF